MSEKINCLHISSNNCVFRRRLVSSLTNASIGGQDLIVVVCSVVQLGDFTIHRQFSSSRQSYCISPRRLPTPTMYLDLNSYEHIAPEHYLLSSRFIKRAEKRRSRFRIPSLHCIVGRRIRFRKCSAGRSMELSLVPCPMRRSSCAVFLG